MGEILPAEYYASISMKSFLILWLLFHWWNFSYKKLWF